MKRVLHAITGTGIGGAERSLLRILRGLHGRYEFGVVSLKPEGALGAEMREAGAAVVSLGMRGAPGLAQIGALRELGREIRRFEPDLVHAWLFQANLLSRFAAGGTANISSLRVEERERPWEVRLDAWSSRRVTRYTAVSQSVARFSVERGLPEGKIDVIPNGLPHEDFEEPEGWRDFRRETAIPEDALLLLCVGRLAPQKGQRFLLEAVSGSEELPSPPWLLFLGDGPDLPLLQALARRYRCGERVRFLPPVGDPRRAYRSADLLVLPSLWEGMPNAVLEAMAQGCPVLSTEVGGAPEIIEDGVNGRLVPPGDSPALRQALTQLLSDTELRERLAAAGPATVRERFPLSRTLELTQALYEELLG
jgi:glycosyltransferase involved in cell wall biosynthesis